MESARRVTLSAAVFTLVCFFLPWVEVSCGSVKDAESGFDLARGGKHALWLMPVLMLAVIISGLIRAWKERVRAFALVSIVSGLASALLMNRERVDADQVSGLAHVTGWFWLGLFSSIAMSASSLMLYLKRSR
jgi:hypothetical protein